MLKKHASFPGIDGPILTVIMDGIGLNDSPIGNAVLHANTPTLDRLARDYPHTTLLAHGKAVGMPSDADMGNSEVGHNALGAGQVFSQGAALVSDAIASGSLFTKIGRGFQEWLDLGLLEGELPTFHGAQAAGCGPVARAFADGDDVCRPVRPDTIAKSLAIGTPADGPYALDLARRTGGTIAAVDDEEIRAGIRLLAETTGVFTETAGGVTTATLAKLAETGEVGSSDSVVVYITGEGLKTLDAVRDGFSMHAIEPTLESFAATVGAPDPVAA